MGFDVKVLKSFIIISCFLYLRSCILGWCIILLNIKCLKSFKVCVKCLGIMVLNVSNGWVKFLMFFILIVVIKLFISVFMVFFFLWCVVLNSLLVSIFILFDSYGIFSVFSGVVIFLIKWCLLIIFIIMVFFKLWML